MPNRLAHTATGAVVGLIGASVIMLAEDPDAWPALALGASMGGFFGAMVPDLIDLPTGPNHRSLGHSITLNAGVLFMSFWKWIPNAVESHLEKADKAEEKGNTIGAFLWRMLAGFLWGLVWGHISHLVLDMRTPKRLPMLF